MGPENGTPPVKSPVGDGDPAGFEPNFFPVMASQTAGSSRDDVLLVQTKLPGPIVDNSLTRYLNRQIEVWAVAPGIPDVLISWGAICRKPILVDGTTDTYSFEARIGDDHFGQKLEKIPTWDPLANKRLDVMWPLVFNPEIDGLIAGNMSDKTSGWHFVISPESVRTEAAAKLQKQEASFWKLSDAVRMICWLLNPFEPYITNPSGDDIEAAFSARDDLLKNVEIPIGTSLPRALDLLLGPLEYGWHLQHGVDKDNQRETTIRFYERGVGQARQILMQRPGEVRDIRKTQVAAFDTTISNVDLANRVIVYGDYQKREVTVELVMAWDPQYDNKRLSDLNEGAPFAKDHPEVGRKFVWNEAGDYINLRPEITAPADTTGIFPGDPLAIRRRKFLRCLSQHEDADDHESNGYRVEWYNRNAQGAVDHTDKFDKGWQRVKWPFSVLEKECGIVFDGATAPLQLWSLVYAGTPELVHVRITATIAGDNRVKGDATRQASSSNKRDITLTLTMPDKFQDSRIDESTNYGSIFQDKPTDARDDTTAIQSYAEQIRNVEDCLRLDLAVPLEGGLHPEYQIGNVIKKLGGRNIWLDLSSNRFPQVVGIVHHFQQQQVELLLESFRKERPRVVLNNGNREVIGPMDVVERPHPRKKVT